MKTVYKIFFPVVFILPMVWAFGFKNETKTNAEIKTQEIKWISFEEAMVLSGRQQKKIIIDVYTDWCGWCKRMDVATFQNPVIAKYVAENYYPVRFNAEQKTDILVGDRTYKFIPQGARGYHELASELMNGKMSYPTIVFLDDNFNLIQSLPGYRGPEEMEPIVKFFGSNAYKSQAWEDYAKSFKAEIGQ